jgi:hypothetical protein
MNQLIDNIIKQVDNNSNEKQSIRDLKLIELVVQECIDIIENYKIPVGNSAAGELAADWTYDALVKITNEIKEHFKGID